MSERAAEKRASGLAGAASTPKKQVDIEKLLQWAYLDELPKRHISAAEGIWERLAQYGSLGGVNPDASRFAGGGAQRYAQFGLPHPDAEEIERAVGALQQVSVDNDIGRVAGELAALVSVNDLRPRKGVRVEGRASVAGYYDKDGLPPAFPPRDMLLMRSINVAALVTMHAVLGTRPDWTSGTPRPYPTPAAHGRGAKIVGECRGKNLYATGSYCPLRWSPSPVEIVLGRADYHVWHQALIVLSETLKLREHEALPPAAAPAPWLTAETPQRVFAHAAAHDAPLPLRPSRPIAGRPSPRNRSGKSRRIVEL